VCDVLLPFFHQRATAAIFRLFRGASPRSLYNKFRGKSLTDRVHSINERQFFISVPARAAGAAHATNLMRLVGAPNEFVLSGKLLRWQVASTTFQSLFPEIIYAEKEAIDEKCEEANRVKAKKAE
jgi:hypothetical protein